MTNAKRIQRLEAELAILAQQPAAGAIQRIDLLNDLAWQLSDIDGNRAYALAEEAHALANELDGSGVSHQVALAHSLRTLGYINQRLGKHQLGLSQLLQALELCEAQALTNLLPDVLDGLAGIYFQIGDYPIALDYIHRQLAAAQRSDDKRQIVNALNNLAALYWQTGERERTVETLQQNLRLAQETDFDRILAMTLINLAEVYSDAGENELARTYMQQGLRVSQTAGFIFIELYAYLVAGAIERRTGNEDAALTSLNHALAMSRSENMKVVEVQTLMTLGEVHLDRHRFDLALATLQQALAVATEIDAKDAMYNAHQRLADGYEKIGDAAQALVHLKQYQALKEVVAGEKAEQRLQVLQVAHDTATARQEAENARLRSAELSTLNAQLEQQVAIRTAELTESVAQLQTEIVMREQVEAEIHQLVDTLQQRIAARTDELATFFDLTLLAGQATDLSVVFDQVLPRVMEVTRSRAICLHLFDDAHTTLHMAAQQNLPDAARNGLQIVIPDANFAHWLQRPTALLVTTDLAALMLLPAAFRHANFQTYLGAQIKIGGRTVGLLSCYRFTDRGYAIDEIALVTALAEQLGMVLETQRLRQSATAMAVLEERQRLARDLHDSVTQSLYSLTLFSRAGREAAEDGDSARLAHSLTELERNTLHALREMRLLLYELRPADLQQEGLTQAIQLRLDTVERRVGLQLDVQLAELPPLPPDFEVQLYHIIVEALNNVVKHAAASRLHVALVERNSCLSLTIEDDGRGFDPVQRRGGLGLGNIRERITLLHGEIAITSAPACGTRLEAVIPYPVG